MFAIILAENISVKINTLCCEVWGLSNDHNFSAIIGRKRRTPPVFLRSQGPVTRSITQARNSFPFKVVDILTEM
jgi:hypothetical protein